MIFTMGVFLATAEPPQQWKYSSMDERREVFFKHSEKAAPSTDTKHSSNNMKASDYGESILSDMDYPFLPQFAFWKPRERFRKMQVQETKRIASQTRRSCHGYER